MQYLSEGLVTTALGISIVMIILFLISISISLMKYVSFEKPKVIEPPKAVEPRPAPVALVAAEDDSELVAVITAALAASLNTSTDKLIVRSIKRSDNWSKAKNNF